MLTRIIFFSNIRVWSEDNTVKYWIHRLQNVGILCVIMWEVVIHTEKLWRNITPVPLSACFVENFFRLDKYMATASYYRLALRNAREVVVILVIF